MPRLPKLIILALFMLPGSLAAQAESTSGSAAVDPGDPIPLNPDVLHGVLDNGLHYYVLANDRPKARAELRLLVKAGSILEGEDQLGVAHYVEHMAFNGTEHFEETELVDFLQSIGIRFGADLNAGTTFDYTMYRLTVPTDSAGLLGKGLLVLEDWAHGLVFDPEQMEKERGVVIEEWRGGRGAGARMQDEQLPVLFYDSHYADRLPIGTLESLQTFDPDAARRFYNTWYQPDLMSVIAVGDFDAARVEQMIRERFGRIPAPETPTKRPVYPMPYHDQTLFAIATDPEASGTLIQIYYKNPVEDAGTVADYRGELVERLYRQMFNQRLRELTREANPPFIFGTSGEGRIVRTSAVDFLFAAVRPGGIARGLETLATEAERVGRHGFTATELERAKRELLDDLEGAYKERKTTESANYAGSLLSLALHGTPAPSVEWEFTQAQRLVPTIGLEEVNAVAQQTISRENRVVTVSAPEKEGVPVPSEGDLRSIFAEVQSKTIAPYEDEVSTAPLVASVPEPADIVETRVIDEIGTTYWRLANGVRVFLKPTDFKADQVMFRAYSPGGSSLAPDSEFVSSSWASRFIAVGGVGPLDATGLTKRLAGQSASVNPWIGGLQEGLSGGAAPENLETMFQLIYLRFTAPRKDSTAFSALKSRIQQSLQARGASPQSAFTDTLNVTMAQHHFRARPPTPELFEEVDLSDSFDFYRARFADAGDFTFVFVGAFNVDSIRSLVRSYLGGLPSTPTEESWRDVGIDPPTGVIKKVIREGIAPKARTRIQFTGTVGYSRENAYMVGSLAAALRIRLQDIVRENASGTYGVQVGGSTDRYPDGEYTVWIGFESAPDRLESLTALVFEEIRRMQAEGASAELVGKIQEIQRNQWETNLEENGYWLSSLAFYDRMDRDLAEIMTYGELIDDLTPTALQAAARTYLRLDNYVRVSLYPEGDEQTS